MPNIDKKCPVCGEELYEEPYCNVEIGIGAIIFCLKCDYEIDEKRWKVT